MKKLTVKQIDKAIASFVPIDGDRYNDLLADLVARQPVIGDYVFSVDKKHLNEDEHSFMMNWTVFIWRIMSEYYPDIPVVSESTIEMMREELSVVMEDAANAAAPSEVHRRFIKSCRQENLFMLIINALMSEPTDASRALAVREKNKPDILMHLRIIIDALDHAKELGDDDCVDADGSTHECCS